MANTYAHTKQSLAISSESIHSSLASILEKVNQMNRKYEDFFSQFETASIANEYIISNSAHPKTYGEIDAAQEGRTRGTTIHTFSIEYETATHDEAHVVITGAPQKESPILDVTDDPLPQTTQVEVPDMVVFLNKELTDLEVRESLTSSEVLGDDMPVVCGSAFKLEVLMASPKIKSSEKVSFDIYKLVDLLVIAIGERSYPNVISFLIYTLRTRWFFKRGRMLWLCTGLRGRGSKSGRQAKTRLKESKWPTWQSDYILEFMHLINCDVIYYFVY
ncbi:hypothetical protein CASFOL_028891 [Castilleja foliolosa]|uniref:Uncharacterized protein n=1 Tax=Castilleja foliolosa TaxID=1961234 RepID=A0ABD3CD86_9LAMI